MSSDEPRLSRVQAWFAALPRWRGRALAFGAGMIAALGHAPLHIVPAYVVGVVVLMWLLDAAADEPRRARAFFVRGWWWGAGHFAASMYWIVSPFMVDSASWGLGWAIPCLVAFAGGLALFIGAGAALAAPFWTRDMRRIPLLALTIAVTEYLRGTIFTGFPWNLPAYVWKAGEPVSQVAAFLGVYGLSAFTLLIALAPAAIADGHASAARRFAPTLGAALVLGLVWGAGANRLAHAPTAAPGETPIVRVADSGLGQAEKWADRPDQEWRVLARYLRATGAPEESRASVVLWPEGAIPTVNFFVLENPSFLAALGRNLGDRALVMGFTRRGIADDSLVLFNSAVVIDGVSGQTRVSQVYDKHHLVPFGEYIPFWRVLEAGADAVGVPLRLTPLQQIGAGFEPGPPPTRLVIPDAPPAVVLICYEAIFPGMTPRGEERPGWLISLTNDAWFGTGSGPWQHFNIARYRAIEEGLPMARAASGGISAVVDAFGRPAALTARQGASGEAQLPPALPPTLFATLGFLLTPAFFGLLATVRLLPFGRGGGRGRAS